MQNLKNDKSQSRKLKNGKPAVKLVLCGLIGGLALLAILIVGTMVCGPPDEDSKDSYCPKFNFENAMTVSYRLSEQQAYSIDGKLSRDISFNTVFNVVSFAERSEGARIEIRYVENEATVKQGNLVRDTKTDPILKQASDDLVGRSLTYELDENHRVTRILGLKQLLESQAGKVFAGVMDESMFKRSLEKLLLSRDDIARPLSLGDSWQWVESTKLDDNATLKIAHEITLDRLAKDKACFSVSTKPTLESSQTAQNSAIEGQGKGEILWDRKLQLPTFVSLNTTCKFSPPGSGPKVIELRHKTATSITNRVPNPKLAVSPGKNDPTAQSKEPKSIGDLVNTERIREILGDEWKQHAGLLITDDRDLEKYRGQNKEVVKATYDAARKNGVSAMGEFSYSRTKPPLNNVTIRLFEFASLEKADAFRKLKYESEKAAPLYKTTEEDSTIIYDSLQINKRIIFKDKYWITCGQMAQDNLHIRILKKCVNLPPH